MVAKTVQQICVRSFIVEGKDDFLDKVSKWIKNIKVEDPLSPDINIGSMISKGHLANSEWLYTKWD